MVIDKLLIRILCMIYLCYFTGISAYTYIPEIVTVDDTHMYIFYWINNTVMLCSSTFIFSKFVLNIKAKVLIVGTSIFFLMLGITQILDCMGILLNEAIWLTFCPLYIIFTLICYKLCRQRSI